MNLPDVSRLQKVPERLADLFHSFGLTSSCVRGNAESGDDLRGPLRLTRAAKYRDDLASRALRLWMGGEASPVVEVASWMGMDRLQTFLDCGLLTVVGHSVHAPFHLRIVEHLFLFSDYLGSHDDAVMGAGETTELLYQSARPEGFVQSVLDLGCGAGSIGLLLARRSGRVVGSDISERAVAIARCNARVNGIDNAVFVPGDCFAPVQGRRFDLILSQPPYYPDDRAGKQVFLAGGRRGDEIARRIIRECPSHLIEQGRALVLSSWAAEAQVPHPPGTRLLELYTPVGDVPGSRQSLVIVELEPRDSWFARFEVPGECWGSIQPRRIDELLRCQQWLRRPEGELRLVEGASSFTEGAHRFLQARSDALLPTRAVSDTEWQILRDPNCGPSLGKRSLVALGWLVPK